MQLPAIDTEKFGKNLLRINQGFNSIWIPQVVKLGITCACPWPQTQYYCNGRFRGQSLVPQRLRRHIDCLRQFGHRHCSIGLAGIEICDLRRTVNKPPAS